MLISGFLLLACQRIDPGQEGKTVFRYNESSGITSLDPAFSKDLANIWPCNLIYNGLVELDSHLRPVPMIARTWEISPDGLRYTFHLRDDVFFHDHDVFPGGSGRKVTAHDFEYSFTRLTDPKTASPGAWVFSKVRSENGKYAFAALNDSTFRIELTEPFPPFLGILAMKYCSVVPHEAMVQLGDEFRRNPVGTGPFQFKVWKEGVKLVLTRNDHYFEIREGRRLPYLDAVAVTFQIDKQSAFLEFVKGNLDFLSGIDPSYKDEVLTADGKLKEKYSDRFYLMTMPYLNTEYLGFLVDTSLEAIRGNPFTNKNVRKAMNWGIDRTRMAKHLRNNLVLPGDYGIIPPGLSAFDSTGHRYRYDPARARKLLEQEGYPQGEGLPELSLFTTAEYLDIFKFLQYQWEEIGIKVRIEVTPYATLKELKAQSKVTFFRASWIADYPDEENYLSLFCSWNFTPAGPNYTHFSSTDYDRLYQLSLRTPDDSTRMAYYARMNEIIQEESPVIILYYDQVVRLVSNRIRDLGINPLNMLSLKTARVEETGP